MDVLGVISTLFGIDASGLAVQLNQSGVRAC